MLIDCSEANDTFLLKNGSIVHVTKILCNSVDKSIRFGGYKDKN